MGDFGAPSPKPTPHPDFTRGSAGESCLHFQRDSLPSRAFCGPAPSQGKCGYLALLSYMAERKLCTDVLG